MIDLAGKIRVADYISEFVARNGVTKVFMVVGGMSMHIVDAFARQPGLRYVCMHHEQACVMAAEGYARETGNFGVACVTAGPGATNTLTGVVSAHFDSSPCMIIAGQTQAKVIKAEGVRQFGVQGFNTLPIFANVTKYSVVIEDPLTIRYHLEKALYLCKNGHPGVVWLEVPLNVQGFLVDPAELKGYEPEPEKESREDLNQKLPVLLKLLRESKRPLFLFGNGVRLSKSIEPALAVAERLQVPIITSRLGIDLINSDHPLFVGRPGIYGERAANFATQGCDLLICVGCRLSMSLTGYDYQGFAKNAKRVMVDIDEFELKKPNVAGFDLAINCDARLFLEEFLKEAGRIRWELRTGWLERCISWKRKYPVVLPEYAEDSKGINTYYFTEMLSKQLAGDDTLVVDTSSCFHVISQALKIKTGQRYITTGGLSTMGYALPAAIGVASTKNSGRVVAVTGDGSLQMNIQELQTLVHYRLPVKLFVWNNNGYLLIRHTQMNFEDGRFVGESPKSGLSCPDTGKIAWAYGIKFLRVSKVSDLDASIKETLEYDGPVICEIMTPEMQPIVPRVSSEKLPDGRMVSKPFDDMSPFLDRKTYAEETRRDD